MIITAERFVCFLDILGFKDKVMRKTHEEIYEELKIISNAREKIEKKNTKSKNKGYENYIVNFSDSIIMFSENNSFNSFRSFLDQLKFLFATAIKNKIMLKGGIAYGKITMDRQNNMYFGQPIIDAFEIEKDIDYLGVVSHFSVDAYLEKIPAAKSSKHLKRLLFEGKSYLKSGLTEHYNLNWFLRTLGSYREMDISDADKKVMKNLKILYKTASGSPRRYIDNTIKTFESIKNTVIDQEIKYKLEKYP